MNTSEITVQTGDQIFTHGKSRFNELTEWLSLSKGEDSALALHQGVMRDHFFSVHATFQGVIRIPWETYKTSCAEVGTEWIVLRRCDQLTMPQIEIVKYLCDEMTGDLDNMDRSRWKYSWFQISLQARDGILNKILPESVRCRLPGNVGPHHELLWFRRFGDLIANRVICSRTGNRINYKLGHVPKWMTHADPDMALDYMMNCHPTPQWYTFDHSPGWTELVRHVHLKKLQPKGKSCP